MLVRPSSITDPRSVTHRAFGTVSEAEPVLLLCAQGKLFEVEQWIADGKPIQFHPPGEDDRKLQRRHTALQIAVRKGFHSLVELLLANGYDPNGDYYECLSTAVRDRSRELVELLLKYGADPDSADFSEVLGTCDRSLMDVFVAAGIDPCRRNALARALLTKRRPILGFVKQYRQRFPDIQRQIDIALHVFADQGDPRGVALMLWLGGNPHADTPSSAYEDDQNNGVSNTAFEAALWSRKAEVLAMLLKKPIPVERAAGLLRTAAYRQLPDVITRLLAAGADPNAEEEGYPILHSFIACLLWRISRPSEDDAKRGIEALETVLKAGAHWHGITDEQLKNLRRTMLKGEPKLVIRILELLRSHGALRPAALAELTRTGSMKALINSAGGPPGPVQPSWPVAPIGKPVSTRRGYWKRHWSQR